MIPIPQIELNVMRAYIKRVKKTFPVGTDLSDRYLSILKISERQLKRKLVQSVQTLDDLIVLKTGHRMAEKFLFDIDIGDRKDKIEEIGTILNLIALEFFAEIQEIAARHPELKEEIAEEEEEYRLQWNQYVTGAGRS